MGGGREGGSPERAVWSKLETNHPGLFQSRNNDLHLRSGMGGCGFVSCVARGIAFLEEGGNAKPPICPFFSLLVCACSPH